MRAMGLDSIECVSYSDSADDDDDAVVAVQLPSPFLMSASTAGAVAAAVNVARGPAGRRWGSSSRRPRACTSCSSAPSAPTPCTPAHPPA
ncbi:hypothetical protein ACP70R_028122 [Stipagrostis hirtigluma subsp. patula]